MRENEVVGTATCKQSGQDTGSRFAESNRYFRMGAAVALGEVIRSGVVKDTAKMRAELRGYLESFGICGMEDVEALGIGNVYRYDFEAIFCSARDCRG